MITIALIAMVVSIIAAAMVAGAEIGIRRDRRDSSKGN